MSRMKKGPRFGLQCVIVVFPDHTHLLSNGVNERTVQCS